MSPDRPTSRRAALGIGYRPALTRRWKSSRSRSLFRSTFDSTKSVASSAYSDRRRQEINVRRFAACPVVLRNHEAAEAVHFDVAREGCIEIVQE